ncbi:MAG: hypothetical protein R3A79_02060 [Nannocystaceae bacterium]
MVRVRAPLRVLLPLAVAAAACGDDTTIMTSAAAEATAASATTDDATTSSSTTDDATTSTTATTGPDETTSTTAPTSTTSTTDATTRTTGATTDATTSDSDSDSATTGDVEDAEYAAMFFPGGLDRVFIRKAEKNSGRCTELRLVWPGMQAEPYAIDTPPEWGVEFAMIADGLGGCLTFEPLAQPTVDAAAGVGAVTWPGQPICPTTLDVEVTLDFLAGDLPWVPMKDTLSATQLAVDGC